MVGKGVPTDSHEAVKWFRAAAEQGDELGMKNSAVSLRNGDGVQPDPFQAAEWFEKASAKGSIQAKSNLADMYAEGDGIPSDYQRAEALYKEIIDSKDTTYHESAVFGLALLYTRNIPNPSKAFSLWQEAAMLGNATAQFNFGLCYHNGYGTAKDDDQALFWWQKAAAQGNSDAQHNIDVVMSEKSSRQNSPQSSQPAKSGGCYIATAVYGSYDCPQVWVLRRFRDYKLASAWYGRIFIQAYYTISPTIVNLFGKPHGSIISGRITLMQ